MRPIDIVKKLAPHAKQSYLNAFAQGDHLFLQYGITTRRRVANFLAQIFAETGGLTIEYESGNYSAERLVQIFGSGHHAPPITYDEAQRLAHNGPAIFERVYGQGSPDKARELGNTRPGDGYLFRGTGPMQMTGGDNFRRIGQKIGVDLYNHPELALDPRYVLLPAFVEWDEDKLNGYADNDDVLSISRAINFGNPKHQGTPNGYSDRVNWLHQLEALIDKIDLSATPAPPIVPLPSTTPAPSKSKHVAAGTVVVAGGAAAAQAHSSGVSLPIVLLIVAGTVAMAALIWYAMHKRAANQGSAS